MTTAFRRFRCVPPVALQQDMSGADPFTAVPCGSVVRLSSKVWSLRRCTNKALRVIGWIPGSALSVLQGISSLYPSIMLPRWPCLTIKTLSGVKWRGWPEPGRRHPHKLLSCWLKQPVSHAHTRIFLDACAGCRPAQLGLCCDGVYFCVVGIQSRAVGSCFFSCW